MRHAAFDWLHGATITTVEQLLDCGHTRRLALSLGGRPRQLSNRLRAVLLGQFLDLGGDFVGGALLAARTWPPAATIGPRASPALLSDLRFHLADFRVDHFNKPSAAHSRGLASAYLPACCLHITPKSSPP